MIKDKQCYKRRFKRLLFTVARKYCKQGNNQNVTFQNICFRNISVIFRKQASLNADKGHISLYGGFFEINKNE